MNIAIDFIGALLAAVSGFLYIKKEPVAWLVSLAAIPFDMTMDFTSGIYGDLVLQILYFALLLHGWFQWRAGDKAHSDVAPGAQLVKLTFPEFTRLFSITLIPVIFVWLTLYYYLGSEVALLDSTVTVCSILGIWLLSRKVIESWLFWVAIDVLYIILFSVKLMPFHAMTAFLDACICMSGYICWVREYQYCNKFTLSTEKRFA